jgi:hypothetical protein
MIPVIYPNYYPHQTTYSKRDNVATIVTTKVGTFSSTWKGSGTLYFDPGDGGPIEPLVLTTSGVVWNHAYPSAGSKSIRITGDLDGVTWLNAASQQIINSLTDIIYHLTSLSVLTLSVNSIIGNLSSLSDKVNLVNLTLYANLLSGDLGYIASLNKLVYLYLFNNSLSFTYTQFPAWDGATYSLASCVSTSQEVGDLILAAANGGMNNCVYDLSGTDPAPPDTQEVTDGIVTLAGNGVTLYVST